MKKMMGGASLALVLGIAGCGSSVSSSPSSHVTVSSTSHVGSCPSGTIAVTEQGKIHCLTTSLSSKGSQSSPADMETAVYIPNADWSASTNRDARHYMTAVVHYMNRGGSYFFPKQSPFSFPLHWTVSLMNGGGPAGNPIVLWQLSMPASYTQWNADQWQSVFAILRNQWSYSGFSSSHFHVVDQAFQVVAPNSATIRFVMGHTIQTNALGITGRVPTWVLMWQSNAAVPLSTIWLEWEPTIPTRLLAAPANPQFTAQLQSHLTVLQQDFRTSGQQIWQRIHTNRASSSSVSTISSSIPSVVPSSGGSTGFVPEPSTPSSSPSGSSSPSSSSVSSPSSTSPSPTPNYLTVSAHDAPTGIQVQWTSSTPGDATPLHGCTVDLFPQGGSVKHIPLTNGGTITGLTIGQTYEVQDVSCGPGTYGYGPITIEYGMKAIQLISLGPSVSDPTQDWLFVTYDKNVPNQTPDQNFADYDVQDLTAHVRLPVTSASLSSGQLRLGVTLPANVQASDTIQVTTTKSVVFTSQGAPSVTTGQTPLN